MLCKHCLSRREFMGGLAEGLGAIALSVLAGSRSIHAASQHQFQPLAKQVLQIFCPGGVSQMDTFDYKPELQERHGQPLPGEEGLVSFQGKNGNLMASPWSFKPRGQSGKMISELLPQIGEYVDEIAFIHSMTSKTNTHGPACVMMNTGFLNEGFPSAGGWVSYALGSENDNLPTYVAIPDVRGIPPSGPANWSSGFLPPENQATVFNAIEPIRNLARPTPISSQAEAHSRDFQRFMNEQHAARHPGNPELLARVHSYELAARMQMSAPEVSNLEEEPDHVHEMYGTRNSNRLVSAYAKNCLLARRLIERGVRFVTLYCGSRASGIDGLLNWDAHKTLKQDYERHCQIFDGATAALLEDLEQRGLMDETLVLWTTEFGRMPTHQEGTAGRDHNPDGFTAWMMGAGVQGGVSYGQTDEFGRRAAVDITTVYDFYATVLRILGLDHTRLTYYHNGIERRLTDVHGKVIEALLKA